MEIKVNDYVRTKGGLIFKIIGGNEDNWDLDIDYSILKYYEENWLELFKYNDNNSFFTNENIIKSSPNIIDLIEVGDYVNGLPVRFIEKDRIDIGQAEDFFWLKNENITSVLTKEMFEQMEYKI